MKHPTRNDRRHATLLIALFVASFCITFAYQRPSAAIDAAVASAQAAVPGAWPSGALTARATGLPVTVENDATILVTSPPPAPAPDAAVADPPPPPDVEPPVDGEAPPEARAVLASLIGDSLDDVRGEALALSEAFEVEETAVF